MVTKSKGQGTVVALAQSLSAGAAKHLSNVTNVILEGSSYTAAQIATKLQEVVSLRTDVDAAKATTTAKLAAETAQMPALRTFMSALVSYVKAAYGGAPDVLADFGIHPKTRTPLTVEAKAAAAAKRAATRKARNTMGSVQKKAVKGDVVGITVTPVTAAKPTVTAPTSPSAGTTSPVATTAPAPKAT
jgi:hypothetical protein